MAAPISPLLTSARPDHLLVCLPPCSENQHDVGLRKVTCCTAGAGGLQVKENFDRFISCKDTIDDIHVRLRANESGPNSTTAVEQAVSEVAPPPPPRPAGCSLLAPPRSREHVSGLVVPHSLTSRSHTPGC